MAGKFEGKYIISDFDGTLAHKSVIPQRNIDAVKYFTDNGGLFSVNTGRSLNSIRFALNGTGLVVNAPLLCCNSALVYDDVKKQRVTAWEMDGFIYDVGRYILKNYPDVGLEVMYDDVFIIVKHDEYNAFHVKLEQIEIREGDIDSVNHPLQKMLVTGHPDRLKVLENDVKKLPGFDFSTVYTHPSFFEILPKGVTKAVGVKYAADYLNIKPENVIAVGDYYNDIEMLQMAGVAVVPENGLPEVKAVAHKIVCCCEDGAIADTIELLDKA